MANTSELFDFTLASFQTESIDHLNNGGDVLVTAHTGSGKTVPAIYAISSALANNQKAVYTSPIKSLSNQKYAEFSQKYPHWNIGLLTGDFKLNPDADVLIMTTEILQSYLFNQVLGDGTVDHLVGINLKTELGVVVFDEVHYINDPDRGKVWENCLALLPLDIKLVLLSATVDTASFTEWLRDTKGRNLGHFGTVTRPVPLEHYIINMSDNILKVEPVLELVVRPDMEYLIPKTNINMLTQYLKNNRHLPALFFVFSRKKTVRLASSMETSYLEGDEIAEITKVVKRHLHGYKLEYYNKCENYHLLVNNLLPKGVAFHHAGLEPLLKEIVEILFSRGLIKIMFATETFAVGVNSPTKSVVFTSLRKHDGQQSRLLRSHEYVQMSGRAGRRGLDTRGFVYIAPLFRDESLTGGELETLVNGPSLQITSRQDLGLTTLINYLPFAFRENDTSTSNQIIENISSNLSYGFLYTQLSDEITEEVKYLEQTLNNEVESLEKLVSTDFLSAYRNSLKFKKGNATRKAKLRLGKQYPDDYRYIEKVSKMVTHIDNLKYRLSVIGNSNQWLSSNITKSLEVLCQLGYLSTVENDNDCYYLSNKSKVASHIKDYHPVLITDLIFSRKLEKIKSLSLLVSVFLEFLGGKTGDMEFEVDADLPFNTQVKMENNISYIQLVKDIKEISNNIIRKEQLVSIQDVSLDLEKLNHTLGKSSISIVGYYWTKGISLSEAYSKASESTGLTINNLVDKGDFIKGILRLVNFLDNLKIALPLAGESIWNRESRLYSHLDGYRELLIRDMVTADSIYIQST